MRKILVILVLAGLLSAGGCWDERILENQATILGLGVDGVVEDPELVQMTFTNPAFAQEAEELVARRTVQGYSLNQGIMNLQLQRQRRIALGKLSLVAFSEELARGNRMHDMSREFDQRWDINPNAWLAVVQKDDAQALLNIQPTEQPLPSAYIVNVLDNCVDTGQIPRVTLSDYWRKFQTRGITPVIPTVEIDEGERGIIVTGVACINEQGQMAGTLTVPETLSYMLLSGELQRGRFWTEVDYVEQKNRHMNALIKRYSQKINVTLRDGKPVFNITLRLEIDTLDIDMTFGDHIKEEIFDGLETSIARDFQGRIRAVLRKTQGWETDIAGLGVYARIQHPHWFEGRDWARDYSQAEFNIEVSVSIKRIGNLVNPRY